eukprot:TRINITY_DN513_c0_g1_i2.p1 TRINITY_DN513_c0_g1~~TRINITY_DN513_c0_g1_i2.p1  ORF type:complete len:330 (+),score=37.43 TRINITY_DN513_c0_g1_i2:44-1033(+)
MQYARYGRPLKCSQFPLHVAVMKENVKMIKCLLRNGANPNLRVMNAHYSYYASKGDLPNLDNDSEGIFELAVAVTHRKMHQENSQTPDTKMLDVFMQHETNIIEGLKLAIELNNIQIFKYLLDQWPDINTHCDFRIKGTEGAFKDRIFNQLLYYSFYGSLSLFDVACRSDILDLLLSRGAVITDCSLENAAWGNNVDLVEYLMEHGAEISLRAFSLAIFTCHIPLVRYFMKHGAGKYLNDRSRRDQLVKIHVNKGHNHYELCKELGKTDSNGTVIIEARGQIAATLKGMRITDDMSRWSSDEEDYYPIEEVSRPSTRPRNVKARKFRQC